MSFLHASLGQTLIFKAHKYLLQAKPRNDDWILNLGRAFEIMTKKG